MAIDLGVRGAAGWHVITVRGEVDLNSSPQLRKAVLAGLEKEPKVGVDLSAADYMDSSGVATLVEALKSAADKKKKLALVSPSPAVMRVLDLARLSSLFEIRASIEG